MTKRIELHLEESKLKDNISLIKELERRGLLKEGYLTYEETEKTIVQEILNKHSHI